MNYESKDLPPGFSIRRRAGTQILDLIFYGEGIGLTISEELECEADGQRYAHAIAKTLAAGDTESKSVGPDLFYSLANYALSEVYGGDDCAMSESLSVDRVTLNQWRNGKRAPNPTGARAIVRKIVRDAIRKDTEPKSMVAVGAAEDIASALRRRADEERGYKHASPGDLRFADLLDRAARALMPTSDTEYQSEGRGVVRYMLLDRLNRNANPHSAADDTIERLEALALEYENDAPQYAPYRICAVVEMKDTEHQSVSPDDELYRTLTDDEVKAIRREDDSGAIARAQAKMREILSGDDEYTGEEWSRIQRSETPALECKSVARDPDAWLIEHDGISTATCSSKIAKTASRDGGTVRPLYLADDMECRSVDLETVRWLVSHARAHARDAYTRTCLTNAMHELDGTWPATTECGSVTDGGEG